MWGRKDQHYSSMKWHLVKPESVFEKEVEEGWGPNKKMIPKTFASISCASYVNNHTWGPMQLKLVDKINIYQANVCAYCRNKVLKDEGIENRLLK